MKYIPYGRQYIDADDIKAVVSVLKSDWITQGSKVDEFEKVLARYCGAKYAVAVSSGTAALHIACLAAGLGKGDEVITTPLTFLASANSISYTGAKPVFADINRGTANIDAGEIVKGVTNRTRAVLPVHFAGLPCDMPAISGIARKNGLAVIEDACHALGAEYRIKDLASGNRWIKVGSCRHSDMTVFSFHPVKHITTGEGGAVTTNSRKIYDKLRALRSHGVYKTRGMMKTKGPWYYQMRDLGYNYRLTDFQCALGISQLSKIAGFLEKRRQIAAVYNKEFLKIKGIDLPAENENVRSAWHLYPIRIKGRSTGGGRRRKIFTYLRKEGVGVQVHYIPVDSQNYYQRFGCRKKEYPNAQDFYNREISIPIFPALKDDEIKYVIGVLAAALRKYGK